jgi:hypothetical protein
MTTPVLLVYFSVTTREVPYSPKGRGDVNRRLVVEC